MRISEIENFDAEKAAADTMTQNAKRLKQQATKTNAQIKVKKAQQQLVNASKPIKPVSPAT